MKAAKNKYIPPELEIIVFECDDIMTSSSPGDGVIEREPGYEQDTNIDMPW